MRGQVTILIAFAMVAVLGTVALAVDVGYMEHQKTRMQSAADAAALAGASALAGGSSSISAAADEDATLNGFTNGASNTTVTVNNPPKSGPNDGNSNYVEVIIAQPQNTYFLRVVGFKQLNVSARSVAESESSTGCVYSLDPSSSAAVSLSNNANISMSCGLIVDSSSSTALSISNNASLTASSVGITGNYSNSGSIKKYGSGGSLTPTTGMIAVPDPLAAVAAPSVGACTYTGTQSYSNNSTPTLNHGTYCGGISTGNNVTITFNSGTYILAGGGMSFGNNNTISGTGVTFYNTTGSAAGYTGSNKAYAGISLGNNNSGNLSAPTTGNLAGILFFQDRSVSAGSAGSTFSNNSSVNMSGALYFPTTSLAVANNGSGAYTIIVSYDLSFANNATATMNSNYSSLADGSPIKSVHLTE
jgi:hypothetical protein